MDNHEYAPNLRPGWLGGNHWAVAHRCDRCGEIVYRLYNPSEPGEGNLQCLAQPEGWVDLFDLTLCPSCAKSFRDWMAEPRKEAGDAD